MSSARLLTDRVADGDRFLALERGCAERRAGAVACEGETGGQGVI